MIDVAITREDFDPGRARTWSAARHPESAGLSAGFTSICCIVVQALAKGEDAKPLRITTLRVGAFSRSVLDRILSPATRA
jgi:hypothetical protein